MFIEDEARTKNFFARERFNCQCSAEVVEREGAEWRRAMSLFKKKFGKVFALIQPLPDFTLFRLIPHGGLYVRGFGHAFEVSADMKNSEHVVGDRVGMKTEGVSK
jgi:putative heme iron utilization protein